MKFYSKEEEEEEEIWINYSKFYDQIAQNAGAKNPMVAIHWYRTVNAETFAVEMEPSFVEVAWGSLFIESIVKKALIYFKKQVWSIAFKFESQSNRCDAENCVRKRQCSVWSTH